MELIAGEVDEVAIDDFFSLSRFHLTIDEYLAAGNNIFCFATTGHQALKFEDFVELDRLFCNVYFSHLGRFFIACLPTLPLISGR